MFEIFSCRVILSVRPGRSGSFPLMDYSECHGGPGWGRLYETHGGYHGKQ